MLIDYKIASPITIPTSSEVNILVATKLFRDNLDSLLDFIAIKLNNLV